MSNQLNRKSGVNRNRCRHCVMHGFTLIEVVVVIMLIAVILATVIPSAVRWRKARAIHHAADELVFQLQRAKMTAIKEFTQVSIIFDATQNKYYMDRTNSCTQTAGAEDFSLETRGGGVVFNGNGYTSDACVIFMPSGVASRTGVVYLANDDGLKYRIQVTGAGGISKRAYDKNSDSWYQLGK